MKSGQPLRTIACLALVACACTSQAQQPDIAAPQWMTGTQVATDTVLIDPGQPLTECGPELTGRLDAQTRDFIEAKPLANGERVLLPIALSEVQPARLALTQLLGTRLTEVTTKGPQLIGVGGLAATVSDGGYAPCIQLVSRALRGIETFRSDAKSSPRLLSRVPLPQATRLLPMPDKIVFPGEEGYDGLPARKFAAWLLNQRTAGRMIRKELPLPAGTGYGYCSKFVQDATLKLAGKRRKVTSFRLERCECANRRFVGNRVCVEPQWGDDNVLIGIADRSTGHLWTSEVHQADGLQFLLLRAVVTGVSKRDDILWVSQVAYEGDNEALLQRKERALDRESISSYRGL